MKGLAADLFKFILLYALVLALLPGEKWLVGLVGTPDPMIAKFMDTAVYLTRFLSLAMLAVSFLKGLNMIFQVGHAKTTIQGLRPINAEFLFYLLMPPKDCDAIVGDLEERYELVHKKFGPRKANFWYWKQALSSVFPIVWATSKRVAKTATGVAALMELYRKIRS